MCARTLLSPRRGLVALLLCCLLPCAAVLRAEAAGAAESVTLYMPVSERGQLARLCELLLPVWREDAGQDANLAFVPGQGGARAWGLLAREPKNDKRLAFVVLPTFVVLPALKDATYSENELSVVAVLGHAPHALWVPEESPLASLADVIAHGRKLAAEGERLLVAGVGSYSDQHLASLLLERATGVPIGYVPVLGSREAAGATRNPAGAVVRADVCWGYAFAPADMPGMRPLAVAAQDRSPALPEVPTFAELGTPVHSLAHFGIAMQADLGPEALQKQGEALFSFIQKPSVRAVVQGLYFESVGYGDIPAFLGAYRQRLMPLLDEYALVPASLQKP